MENNDVVVRITWTKADVENALKEKGIQPTEENVRKVVNRDFENAIIERSVERGWEVIDDLIADTFN